MNRFLSILFLVISACGSLFAEDRRARVIKYSTKDIIELRCQMRVSTESQMNRYRAKYPSSLKFQYRYTNRDPFDVTAIFHDDAFTYIYSTAREKPAIYEIKDGKPNLINFQLENGCYIVPKVIDH